MDAGRELLVALFIVAVPTVPACLYVLSVMGRRHERGGDADVASGRPPETPFVLIAWVGAIVAVAVVAVVGITLLARALT